MAQRKSAEFLAAGDVLTHTCRDGRSATCIYRGVRNFEVAGVRYHSASEAAQAAAKALGMASKALNGWVFWGLTAPASEVRTEIKTNVEYVKVVDQAAIDKAVAEALAKAKAEATEGVRELIVKINDATPVKIKTPHKCFAKLLKMSTAGCNVWITGPAGSGKTTGAAMVAEALGRAFYFNGAIDNEYKLSGFVDAQGRIVSTAFRKAYTEGGVYLFDEVDASLPGAMLAFNAALANGHMDFPGLDAPVTRHPDFICLAAGNTWGMGATTEYVGRNKMDAAFLDRFVQLDWGYDEALELVLAGDDGRDWCKLIQGLRAKAKARGLKIVISPRATLNGVKLLRAGMTHDEALDATIRAKIAPQDWANLSA